MNTSIRKNVKQVTETLTQCLKQYFRDISPQKHQIAVSVECGAPEEREEGRVRECTLHLRRPDGGSTEGRLSVENSGGNVYRAMVQLDGRKAHTFSLGLPRAEMSPEEMHAYAEDLCEHLLDELEREAGEELLRDATAASEDS